MKQSILVTGGVIVLFAALLSCNVNYSKTPSGLVYKIIPGKGTEKLKPGQIIKFDIAYTLSPKDSLINSTFGKIPGYSKIDTGFRSVYSFMEIIPKCSVGDSVEFILSIDSLKNKKMIQDYNNMFKRGEQINGKLKILKAFNNENDVMADFQKEQELEKEREIKSVEDYLAKNNIKAQKTKGGAFVLVENPGDTAVKLDSNKVAYVKYKGYLQSNGKVFDTNFDTSKGHTDPIKVGPGEQPVMNAWNEGLPYFAKGGKGKIFVPAMLGYGGQPAGEIPAYSNLIFDVEIVDIKAAEPRQNSPYNLRQFPNMRKAPPGK